MLVFTRREGESIRIGDDITITVVAVRKRGYVALRLAVEAPRNIPVHREEIYQAIQREKAAKESREAL
ncbi:hypothetical protein LCGC14_2972210 [marine sediment metagenome]|uniref:Carbon storage regulator n=1 Tax=marine sediment metagenome TaxID=412755 RepID=A0A0F9A0C2_9ZZZZ